MHKLIRIKLNPPVTYEVGCYRSHRLANYLCRKWQALAKASNATNNLFYVTTEQPNHNKPYMRRNLVKGIKCATN